jgi:hypothetical protein
MPRSTRDNHTHIPDRLQDAVVALALASRLILDVPDVARRGRRSEQDAVGLLTGRVVLRSGQTGSRVRDVGRTAYDARA